MMIVGISGYGFSGSGAVIDLLADYNTVKIASESEISLIYKPDGIDDLKRALVDNPVRYYACDSAIRRFKQFMKRSAKELNSRTDGRFTPTCNDFIESIIQVKWKGSTMTHFAQETGMEYVFRQRLARGLRRRFEQLFGPINRPFPPDKEMYYSIMGEDEFISLAQRFLMDIITAMTGDTQKYSHIIVDQLFPADNPEKDFIYFNNVKAIVVSRDPRDVYILSKTRTGMDGRFIPSDNVNDFIRYYDGMMRGSRTKNNKNVLTIQFEELIYQPEQVRNRIECFLGLTNIGRIYTGRFDPKKSINNTQLYLRYPQYSSDIDKIKCTLSDYVFDFQRYNSVPSFNTSTF